MELVRGLHNVDRAARGCVLTIGAFDGIHRGHQEMIRVLRSLAAKHSLPAALLSFEPTPREFFAKATPPARLTRFREKYQALRRYGVERFVCLRFDSALRSMSADEFVGKVLVEALGARHIVVGHDFKFGRNMAGNVATLRAAGPAAGFVVTEVPPFEIDGERVSSSLIRAALDAGDMARAALLLGRPYRMTGKVIEGSKLGRKLGFPTANLGAHSEQFPPDGVYVAEATLAGALYRGVANLGYRPTVSAGKPERLLELHLFDLNRDIYGAEVEVRFLRYLRPEQKFENVEALAAQIARDVAQARG